MLSTVHRNITQPFGLVHLIVLDLRSDQRVDEVEIINSADTQDALAGKAAADTVQERATLGTEVVGHSVAGSDGVRLGKGRQLIAATQVLEILVVDGEVGCEHGCSDLVTVSAVAHEGVDEARAVGREF